MIRETTHYKLDRCSRPAAPAVSIVIRPSTAADVARHHAGSTPGTCCTAPGTFELDAARPGRDGAPPRRRPRQGPALAGARARRRRAPATPTPATFRPRPAYRFCLEDSVYLAPDAHRPGLRPARCWPSCSPAARQRGARQMLAVIGDSANVGVDRRAPRRSASSIPARCARAGWKFDRWLDVVHHAEGAGPGRRDRRARRVSDDRRTLKTARDLGSPLLGGSLGLHRFYLHGARDAWGWLHPWPTLVGALRLLAPAQFGHRRPARQLARSRCSADDGRGGDAAPRSSTA